MNALDEVLNSIRVRSTVYCPIEVGAPWGLYIEEEQDASFCIMAKGSALLVIEDLNIRRWLKAGDFIILTKRCGCKFSDSPHSEHVNLQDWLRRNPPRPDGTYKVEGKSAFANRFTKLVGEPPLRYLSRWRMHKAIEMIHESRLTTAEIASLVGYES